MSHNTQASERRRCGTCADTNEVGFEACPHVDEPWHAKTAYRAREVSAAAHGGHVDIAATTDAVMRLVEGAGVPREEVERLVREQAPRWSDPRQLMRVVVGPGADGRPSVTLTPEPLLLARA